MVQQIIQNEFHVQLPEARLLGTLSRPAGATESRGVVLFAHGSGSGRLSPRNQQVASALVERGIATLLFDLLTEDESRDRRNVFDIELLASRMITATQQVQANALTGGLPIGYFGASTGAAAALVAAAKLGEAISGVVSRGGRPDLAGAWLSQVRAPVCMIVGSLDTEVLELNKAALEQMTSSPMRGFSQISGASHLFEEPGTLEKVAEQACWRFELYFKHHKPK